MLLGLAPDLSIELVATSRDMTQHPRFPARVLTIISVLRQLREFDSNKIDESDSHNEKHDEPRRSTPCGITIYSMDERENAHN
jgi:hypothetical protein